MKKEKKTLRVSTSVNGNGNGVGKGVLVYDFACNAKFSDPDYPADMTAEMREKFKDMHPSMVIGGGNFNMIVYLVTYSYVTVRGNQREGHRYLFIPAEKVDDEMDYEVTRVFDSYIDKFNRENPHRAFSNVQILDVERYANAELAIG